MKKKLKDVTVGEINEICRKCLNCDYCPFGRYCSKFHLYEKKELEEEIEI